MIDADAATVAALDKLVSADMHTQQRHAQTQRRPQTRPQAQAQAQGQHRPQSQSQRPPYMQAQTQPQSSAVAQTQPQQRPASRAPARTQAPASVAPSIPLTHDRTTLMDISLYITSITLTTRGSPQKRRTSHVRAAPPSQALYLSYQLFTDLISVRTHLLRYTRTPCTLPLHHIDHTPRVLSHDMLTWLAQHKLIIEVWRRARDKSKEDVLVGLGKIPWTVSLECVKVRGMHTSQGEWTPAWYGYVGHVCHDMFMHVPPRTIPPSSPPPQPHVSLPTSSLSSAHVSLCTVASPS